MRLRIHSHIIPVHSLGNLYWLPSNYETAMLATTQPVAQALTGS